MLGWTMHEKITLVWKKKKGRGGKNNNKKRMIANRSQVYCNYMIMEKWAFYWEKRDLDSHEISKFKYFCKLGCS